eukprot:CAMPEP_0115073990 /NCGR_PEP_ID=MMETSP0227-20121206/15099_1 /TAXON_ID=89957 /ORGANISM="Polarella glacialis, Strain CCMP 1383" /LENGTH=45 /DNA_ID= /DNA_START= /DNA_END= /DNA_ORIENTATION=
MNRRISCAVDAFPTRVAARSSSMAWFTTDAAQVAFLSAIFPNQAA